ncbi:MAG: type VII toxin-antitoxin system HepT family RNase toxin [Nevskiaceae bacterium]
MADDVLLNKAAIIERAVARAREEYAAAGERFATDYTRQDAAVLNIQRACEAAIDMGQHVVRRDRLGVPQGTREIFGLLVQAHRIEPPLAEALQRMVGFRNIAVHQYQALQLPILIRILETHLDEFTVFSSLMLRASAED